MRILIVSHAPLTAELGAAQVALSLGEALRDRGHDVVTWSPNPLPPGTGWRRRKQVIEEFVTTHGPFEVIDTPPTTATRLMARAGCLVTRSIQPELLYLADTVSVQLRWHLSPRSVLETLIGGYRATSIVAGWRRAKLILCLGSGELEWMRRHFSHWEGKLGVYLSAPSPADRSVLLAVRRQRTGRSAEEGTRFLWIGRWVSHKGIRLLLNFLRERSAGFPMDRFTIAGCGTAAESRIPEDWVRTGRVRIVPSFSRAELPALLASHDAGLFTSSIEGWGLNLNEMLEAGLPVFATRAGAVADLQPFFPESLRPFPPPASPSLELGPLEDLEATGYLHSCSWPEIARRYEEDVLATCRTAY